MSESRRIIELLLDVTEEEARDMALRIHNRVVSDTPVDTGWARSNWIPSIGVPYPDTVGSRDAINAAVQSQGVARLLGWNFSEGVAWLSNNVPYIGFLNEGTSAQAPAGFVERAIQIEVRRSNAKRLA